MRKFGLSALVCLMVLGLVGGTSVGGDWHDTSKVRKYNSSPTDNFKRYHSQRQFSAEKHGDLFYVRNVHKKDDKPYQYYKKRSVQQKRSWSMPSMGKPGMHSPMDFNSIMGHVVEQNKRIVGRSLKYATSHLNRGEAAKVKQKFHESYQKEWSELMRQHSDRFQAGMGTDMMHKPGMMHKKEKPRGPLTSYWKKRPGKFHGRTCPHGMPHMKCDKCAMKMKHGKDCKGCGSDGLCDKCKAFKAQMEKCPNCKPGKPCAMCMEMMKKEGVCDSCKAKLMGDQKCSHGKSPMKCEKCKAKMAKMSKCDKCAPPANKGMCEKCMKMMQHMTKCPMCKPGKPCDKCMKAMKEAGVCGNCMKMMSQMAKCPNCKPGHPCDRCKEMMAKMEKCEMCGK